MIEVTLPVQARMRRIGAVPRRSLIQGHERDDGVDGEHGGSWLATVHDPATGYVALRTVVTDMQGDSSTQTIYQAYAIG